MKVTVIGGAGVRTPLLMSALVRRQDAMDLHEVAFMDIDERKMEIIAPLCQFVTERAGGRFKVTWNSDSREALSNASAVITTIRGGGERGRVLDERIALEHGVLGQETTGAGGFAMALRSIPAVANYARQMRELCPNAWLLNFTNPAGLVAQALTAEFPDLQIVGICDSPITLHRQVAALFGQLPMDVPITFFGLNHLSWMAEAMVDGENVVPRIIADPSLSARVPSLAVFEHDLLRMVGMLPAEYLYFYYYREQAVANIQGARETRGEQVCRLSSELLRDLTEIGPSIHQERAWQRYQQYLDSRNSTYFATESKGRARHGSSHERATDTTPDEGEGYAGVALDILAARTGKRSTMVANVPNRGAIPGMNDGDVVEIVCHSDESGVHPMPIPEVPRDALLRMQQVKRYELLTVEAIRNRSRDHAVQALMAHPLVGSYPLARSLVNAYLDAHRAEVGDWAAV